MVVFYTQKHTDIKYTIIVNALNYCPRLYRAHTHTRAQFSVLLCFHYGKDIKIDTSEQFGYFWLSLFFFALRVLFNTQQFTYTRHAQSVNERFPFK